MNFMLSNVEFSRAAILVDFLCLHVSLFMHFYRHRTVFPPKNAETINVRPHTSFDFINVHVVFFQ